MSDATELAKRALELEARYTHDLKVDEETVATFDYREFAMDKCAIISQSYLELKAAHDKLLEETLMFRVLKAEADDEVK